MLNKIEGHLIAPCVAFTKKFQLKGYGLYGIMEGLLMFQKI
jgi:hypothetical protein